MKIQIDRRTRDGLRTDLLEEISSAGDALSHADRDKPSADGLPEDLNKCTLAGGVLDQIGWDESDERVTFDVELSPEFQGWWLPATERFLRESGVEDLSELRDAFESIRAACSVRVDENQRAALLDFLASQMQYACEHLAGNVPTPAEATRVMNLVGMLEDLHWRRLHWTDRGSRIMLRGNDGLIREMREHLGYWGPDEPTDGDWGGPWSDENNEYRAGIVPALRALLGESPNDEVVSAPEDQRDDTRTPTRADLDGLRTDVEQMHGMIDEGNWPGVLEQSLIAVQVMSRLAEIARSKIAKGAAAAT